MSSIIVFVLQLVRHSVRIEVYILSFVIVPQSTAHNTNIEIHVSISTDFSINKFPFIIISIGPSVDSFTIELVSRKLPFIFVSINILKNSIAFSYTINHIAFVVVSIRPAEFSFAMKLSLLKIAMIILATDSVELSVTMVGVKSPPTLVNNFACFWMENFSIDLLVIFVFASVNHTIFKLVISIAVFLVVFVVSNIVVPATEFYNANSVTLIALLLSKTFSILLIFFFCCMF